MSKNAQGGQTTGQRMSDYPIEDGVFMQAYNRMPKTVLLPFKAYTELSKSEAIMQLIKEAEAAGKDTITIDGVEIPIAAIEIVPLKKKRYKIKYTCPNCQANVWGKPDLAVTCATCLLEYLEENKGSSLGKKEVQLLRMVAEVE